ncbi:hypothetical protein [Phytoactinopolyspora mesophila]|nr:hypothetical protein [Phytoactinopolyspora mesophila]
MKQVVNDALRRALTPPRTDQAIYKVVPHHSGIRPGVDLAGLNRLADEIEDEPTVGKALRSS